MEKQSNSKYYHGDCVCEKKKVPSLIAIECENCIEDSPQLYTTERRQHTICNCEDVEIMHEICKTCAHDRDEIDTLNDKLDDLMYHIHYDIKNFVNCEDNLKEVLEISIKMRHLNRKLLTRLIQPNKIEKIEEKTEEKTEESVKLCENTDCERYPPDWDDEEDTESTYQEGQWKKCCLCDGYFDDDGFGDILFVQEEPNNQEASCDLCGKENDIVQMKGSGQYLCEAACDEDEEEEEEDEEEEEEEKEEENKEDEEDEDEGLEHLIKEDESRLYLFKRLEKEVEESGEEEDKDDYTCGSCGTTFDYKLNKPEYKDNSQDDECSFCGTKFDDKWAEQYKSSKKNDANLTEEEEEEKEEKEEKDNENEKDSENVVEYHVVTTMFGGFDIGYCYADEREYEDEEEALKYYNEISLVTLTESKYTGGVQYKRIESGKAHKLENGEYETVYLNENKEETVNEDEEESEDEVDEDDEKTYNCDLCCRDKSFEKYYVFKRGRKQELYSCVKCWENRKTQLVGETWTWTSHTFPGPAFYTVEKMKKKRLNQRNG